MVEVQEGGMDKWRYKGLEKDNFLFLCTILMKMEPLPLNWVNESLPVLYISKSLSMHKLTVTLIFFLVNPSSLLFHSPLASSL